MDYFEALRKVIDEGVIVWRPGKCYPDIGFSTQSWIRIRLEDPNAPTEENNTIIIEANYKKDCERVWIGKWGDSYLDKKDILAEDWEVVND